MDGLYQGRAFRDSRRSPARRDKTPTIGEEEGDIQFPDEKLLSEKLRSTVFIVGAGTFQDFYEIQRSRPIEFNPSASDQCVGPTSEYIAQKLPRELTNRFNSQLLLLPGLAPSHYRIIAFEAEKSLPKWIALEFRRAAARRMEQAIAAKSGCRFVEEALMDALQLSKPPPKQTPQQPSEDPWGLLEGAANSEVECEL